MPLHADLRSSLRALRLRPAITGAMLLTLALAIGATTAIFSLVYGVLLQPLPYPRPDRLVVVWENNLAAGIARFNVSAADLGDWRRQTKSFSALAGICLRRVNLTGDGDPEQLAAARVGHQLWPLLRLHPAQGRFFDAEDLHAGRTHLAVVSHDFWRRHLGDPRVLGRVLRLDGEVYTVVGVAPAGFSLPGGRELWLQLEALPEQGRGSHTLQVIGRLADGASPEQARAELAGIAAGLARQYPDTNTAWSADLALLLDDTVHGVRRSLDLLLAMVGAVLLLACLNVANLLLVQVAGRERDTALRLALGASRGGLAVQALADSLVLAAIGGAMGLLVAYWGSRGLLALAGNSLPRAAEVGLHPAVLAFAALTSLGTALAFGLPAALQGARGDLHRPLREGSASLKGRQGGRLRALLVILELGLALALVVGSTLLVKSLIHLQSLDPGYRDQQVLTCQLSLPEASYSRPERKQALVSALLDRLRALPAVAAASVSFPLPLDGNEFALSYQSEGGGGGEPPTVSVQTVSPDYFKTLGIGLLRGRDFAASDLPDRPPVVIVSQSLARRQWSGKDPLAKRLTFDDPRDAEARWLTVIGVAADVRRRSLWEPAEETIYRTAGQFPMRTFDLAVRTRGNPSALGGQLRQEIWSIDRELPIAGLRPLAEIATESMRERRSSAALCTLFALLALALACIGVYGIASYLVTERFDELGLRVALGASRSHLALLILRQGLSMVLPGIALGLLLAVLGAQILAGLVVGVAPRDPWILAVAALLLAAAGLAANFLPARKLAEIDPVSLLKRP